MSAMLKKVTVILLVTLLLALCLSACESKNEPASPDASGEDADENAGDETEDADAGEEETPEEPEPEPTIENVDHKTFSDELLSLLYMFNFGYNPYYGADGEHSKEFDCEDKSTYFDCLAASVALKPSCAPLWAYPVDKGEEVWEPATDPLKVFSETGHYRIPKDSVLWVMENIYNISTEDSGEMITALTNKENDPNDWHYVYEYEVDGISNLYSLCMGIGDAGYYLAFEDVRTDGDRYYMVYDFCTPWDIENSKVYYAEVGQKEVDGQKFWSIYKHTEDTSLLPELTVEPNEDVFSMFSGNYSFGSGVGGWGTFMEISPDGTFVGEFHDTNMGESGDGYDSTLYYSAFTGRFSNPKRINDYTYSFELEEIQYENEPNTEEIVTTEDGHRLLMKYWDAYGLNEGTKTIIAYTERAPRAMLPEEFLLWVGMSTEMNYVSEDMALGHRGLFTVESKYGWLGPKE